MFFIHVKRSASPNANLLLDLEFDGLPKPVQTSSPQPTLQTVVKPQAVKDDFDLLPGLSSSSTTHKTGKPPPPKPARSTVCECLLVVDVYVYML